MLSKFRTKSLFLVILIASSFTVMACGGSKSAPDEQPVETAIDETEEAVEEVEDEVVEEMSRRVARAKMISGSGESLGEVTFTQTDDGVQITGDIAGLGEAGSRGFHVHEFGKCDGPDFMSAGGHFNPAGHQHGAPENAPEARHAGDFGNIEINDDDGANLDLKDHVITLKAGENNIVGHALIIHAQQDDLTSQPTGDAGARAACGIIELVE